MGNGLASSIVDAIGATPLIELRRMTRNFQGSVLAKLEYLNPGHSKKDRVARQVIEDAEESGALEPGQTVVELTSGNMGTGLAIVCAVKGYPFVAVMSKGNSTERARMMAALGAEVVLVEQVPGSQLGEVSGEDLALVELRTHELVAERNAFRADQFHLEGAVRAHYLHTGPEILAQSGGAIDAYCDFVGTGSAFSGCAAALKEADPTIQCFVVEPATAAVLAGEAVIDPRHRIQGGGYGMAQLPLMRPELIDGFLKIEDDLAISTTREMARIEGIFGGFSSGANVSAALQLLEGPCRGKTVVTTVCDSGLKYLSTDLWP